MKLLLQNLKSWCQKNTTEDYTWFGNLLMKGQDAVFGLAVVLYAANALQAIESLFWRKSTGNLEFYTSLVLAILWGIYILMHSVSDSFSSSKGMFVMFAAWTSAVYFGNALGWYSYYNLEGPRFEVADKQTGYGYFFILYFFCYWLGRKQQLGRNKKEEER